MPVDRVTIMIKVKALQRQLNELVNILDAIPADAQTLESLANLPLEPLDGGGQSDLLSARQVQAYLGIGESTFYTWVREGRLPPGEQWGGKMKRWSRKKLEAWRLGHREERTEVPL